MAGLHFLIGGDFMLPVNIGGHTAYQNTFVSEFLKLYPNPYVLPRSTWDVIIKFWYLDLSETDSILASFYPSSGKAASRFPSCMLRSYLLSIKLNVSSLPNGANFSASLLCMPS